MTASGARSGRECGGDPDDPSVGTLPAEAVARFAREWADVLLELYPEADRVSVFEAGDIRAGRELAVATRGHVDGLAMPDDVQPLIERRVA
jgi:hypothetical protein